MHNNPAEMSKEEHLYWESMVEGKERCKACVNALAGVPDPSAFMDAVDEMLKTDSLTIESYRQVFWQRLKNLRSARGKH